MSRASRCPGALWMATRRIATIIGRPGGELSLSQRDSDALADRLGPGPAAHDPVKFLQRLPQRIHERPRVVDLVAIDDDPEVHVVEVAHAGDVEPDAVGDDAH